jgi:hypothetical protein
MLRHFVEGLEERRNAMVPLFDPPEAGVPAKVLIVLEAPGPMTETGAQGRASYQLTMTIAHPGTLGSIG